MEAHSGLFSLCRDWEAKDFPAAHKANHPAVQRPGSGEDGLRHTARQTVGEQNEHKQGGIPPLSL